MKSLDFLRGCFQESSIDRLEYIIYNAIHQDSQYALKMLKEELIEVIHLELQEDPMIGPHMWVTSPSGENHIVLKNNVCFLVNIYGVHLLWDDTLFEEGELWISNIHWIEKDRLVLFDLDYIVHGQWKKGICHYVNPNFVFYSEMKNRNLPRNDNKEHNWEW